MSDVRVFNDNIYPYNEKFRERTIHIESKGHITMEEDEAEIFLGKIGQPRMDVNGMQDPRSYKMLRIEKEMRQTLAEIATFKCNRCGFSAVNKEVLDNHTFENHLNDFQDPKVAEKLKAQLKR